MFWLRATVTWLGFAVLAVACGWLRVRLLEPLVGEPSAHVAGTLAVCALFLYCIARFVRWTKVHARGRLLALGVFWTTLTVAFEFGFGHYGLGHSWARLLADYNILAGRIWVLVLLTLYAGPRVVVRVSGRGRN
jgi:hypothetical protein